MPETLDIPTQEFSHEINLEHTKFSIEDLLDGPDTELAELRSVVNQFGFNYKRFADVLTAPDSKAVLLEVADNLKGYLRDINSVTSDVKVLNLCLELSQAYIDASGHSSISDNSDLNPQDLPELHNAFRTVVESISPKSAITGIVKKSVERIFEYYNDYPDLFVTEPYRDYESDVVGELILLEKDALPKECYGLADEIEQRNQNELTLQQHRQARLEAANRRRFEHIKLIDIHPVLLAKGLVGLRDVNQRIGYFAPIDDGELERVKSNLYTYNEYRDLDDEMKDMLSSSPDYERVVWQYKNMTSLKEAYPIDDLIGFDEDDKSLFQEIHRPQIRGIIEYELGLSLGDIELGDQYQLLKFLATRQEDDFDRLCNFISNVEIETKYEVFKSFLALEFGTDFGNTLLDIAEKLPEAELKELLGSINSFRTSVEQISHAFPETEAEAIKNGALERLTEILEVANFVAENGSIEWSIYQKYPINVQSINELIKDVSRLAVNLDRMAEATNSNTVELEREETINSDPDNEFRLYKSHIDDGKPNVLIHTRRKPAKDGHPDIEYGTSGNGVEASANIMIATDGSDTPSILRNERRQAVISFRIDRDGVNSSRNKKVQSTSMHGRISVEIGSLKDAEDSFGTRIGRLIALGNILRNKHKSQQTGEKHRPQLNHNAAHFDQSKLGPIEGFARFIEEFDKKLSKNDQLQTLDNPESVAA